MERSVLVESVNDFIFRNTAGILEINKQSVFSLEEKKQFIMDIFNNYPIGEIILTASINEDTGRIKYKVLNGNKRLNAIFEFCKNEFSIEGIGEDLIFSDLTKNHKNMVKFFLQYKIPVEIIYNETEEELKKIIK